MNYLTHALPYLDRPYFMAGTALPDWLSVVDRRQRLRPRLLQPVVDHADPVLAEIARGALQHLHDDDWFHRTRGFAIVTAQVGLIFREGLRGSDGFRCGFLGHIVTEMLLDSVLIHESPERLSVYYQMLDGVDLDALVRTVELATGRDAQSLATFLPLFLRERILEDYPSSDRLLHRLNQVLRRVKLTPLPEVAADWLSEARELVRSNVRDLLPQEHYPWAKAASLFPEKATR